MKDFGDFFFDLDFAPTNFVDILRWRGEHQSDKPAFTFIENGEEKEQHLSYGELDRQARAIAATLQKYRLKGERVLLLYPPGLEYIAGFLGCLYAGAIAVPVYPPDPTRLNRTLPRLEAIVQDADARVALTTVQIMAMMKLIKVQSRFAGSLEKFPLFRKALGVLGSKVQELGRTEGLERMRWIATDKLNPRLARDWEPPSIDGDTLAYLQYTSGSTGTPKGVMLTHRNLLHNSRIIHYGFGFTRDATGVIWLPMYHDMGLIGGILQPLSAGLPCILMSPLAFLQWPVRWLKVISRIQDRPVISGGPNFAYELCVRRVSKKQIQELDLSNWVVAFSGAEPVRAETIEKFSRTFAPAGFKKEAFYPCYGLAEATLMVSGGLQKDPPVFLSIKKSALKENRVVVTHPDDTDAQCFVGCGRALLDQQIEIVDPETLQKCNEGEIGEIWVASSSVAQGYWKKPEASRETFQARIARTNEGPFLRTGDLGFFWNGELFVTGRLKDLIIIRGRNHYPQDIEYTVEQSHAAVRAGCVAAFSIEVTGEERLVVVAEARIRKDGDYGDVVSAIRQAVAEGHDLQVYAVVLIKPRTIPKTSSGKIRRRATREMYFNGELTVLTEWRVGMVLPQPSDESREKKALPPNVHRAEDVQSGAGKRISAEEIEAWLVRHLAGLLNVPPESLDIRRPFASYGIDSAQAVSLAGELEEWLGIALPPTLLYDYPTIESLAGFLAGKQVIAPRKARPASQTTPSESSEKKTSVPEVSAKKRQEPIAIVGIGVRFPGAPDKEAFWELLTKGVDAIREVPRERWNMDRYYDPQPGRPGKMYTRWGGFIDEVDQFDPQFFGISPREASRIDPQQRLLLEVAWEALEDAGIPREQFAGSRTGVFVGISSNDYARIQLGDERRIDAYSGTGNALSIAANRISYLFDLHGPSVAVDTACSSSLVSLHMAVQALRNGECEMALAGGVNLILAPDVTINFCQAGVMAPDGRCKTFDEKADGYVRGEGAGMVVLKPLSRALADGDPVYAVVLGSAVNSDGRSNGLMAPNQRAQERVIREALQDAGVAPADVQYVEAHGTGTKLGDPIEVKALGNVLAQGRPEDRKCALGSVKTNIGHLESAAGIAGVIKTALAIKYRQIPPSIHFQKPNPHIPFDDLPVYVQTELGGWPDDSRRLIAGVTSLGFGGTNSHAILAEPPAEAQRPRKAAPTRNMYVLPLSAQTESALQDLTAAYLDALGAGRLNAPVHDIAYTACLRRSHHDVRLAVPVSCRQDIRTKLEAFRRGEPLPEVALGRRSSASRKKIAFVFSGQGAQWWAMGQQLLEAEPVFRQAIEAVDREIQKQAGWSLLQELQSDEAHSRMDDINVIQPALFGLQVALARLWQSWGIAPDAVIGHSMGEVAAAYIAGILDLESAVKIIHHRSRLMKQVSGKGLMAVVELTLEEARQRLQAYRESISIAVQASPGSVVISGEPGAIQDIVQQLEAESIFCRILRVDVASHSPQMDPLRTELIDLLKGLQPRQEDLPFYSTVRPGRRPGTELDARYWGDNLREMVRFKEAVERVAEDGIEVFLEISPHPILSGSVQQTVQNRNKSPVVLPSLKREEDEQRVILGSLGKLYTLGFPVRWEVFFPEGGEVISLPTYPWQKERYWFDTDAVPPATRQEVAFALDGEKEHPLLGVRRSSPVLSGKQLWETVLSPAEVTYLQDHRVQKALVFPAAGYVEMALFAAQQEKADPPFTLENVTFHRALVLPEQSPARLQLVLSRANPMEAAFQIYSAENGARENGAWTLNSSGTIRFPKQVEPPETLRLEHLREACPEELPAKSHFDRLKALGLEYGPAFQGIQKVWRGKARALASVVIPEPLNADLPAYFVHPVLLDACFQTISDALPQSRVEGNGRFVYLPVGIDRVEIYGRPGARLWSYAEVHAVEGDGGVVRGDITVLSPDGKPLMRFAGLRLQRLGSPGTENLQDWLYTVEWEAVQAVTDVPPPERSLHLLLVGGEEAFQADLQKVLQESGLMVTRVRPGQAFERIGDRVFVTGDRAEDIRKFLETLRAPGVPAPEEVLFLAEHDSETEPPELARQLIRRVTLWVQALSTAEPGQLPRFRIVTRGGMAVEAGETGAPHQATLWGFGNTLFLEQPELRVRLVDVPQDDFQSAARALLWELSAADDEHQVAYRGDQKFVPRLRRFPVDQLPPMEEEGAASLTLPQAENYRLSVEEPGRLDGLALIAAPRQRPGAGEVEIEVRAAGVNFRDVMNALGIYPEGPIPLGAECAGVVTAVGKGVSAVRKGDRVMAIAPESFSRYVCTTDALVFPIPEGLVFEEAATLPVAFLTAYYALHHLAHLEQGERVLIHAASGGVGLAAVQIARMKGAEIFATAGTPEKRRFLKSLGIAHVFNSRGMDFAEQILETTEGQGVDVVLNSLAGEGALHSLSVLGTFGRFLEIGKTDIYLNGQLDLYPFRNNLAYFAIDLDRVIRERPGLIRRLFEEVLAHIQQGRLEPLPRTVFSYPKAVDAFRYMARRQHIGKIVLVPPGIEGGHPEPSTRQTGISLPISERACYLITGGMGALGMEVARWFIDHGARHLILVGRTAPGTKVRRQLKQWEENGINIQVEQLDVSQREQVEKLFKNLRSWKVPLKGVVHAAGTLADATVARLQEDQIQRVVLPKVMGAWYLHQYSREMPLDFFVLYSSAAAVFGSPGQAHYAAANAFLDALAHWRRRKGLPALSINWGPWTQIGLAARSDRAGRLERRGFDGIAPRQGMQAFQMVVALPVEQVVIAPIQWHQLRRLYQGMIPPSVVRSFVTPAAEPTPPKTTGPQETSDSQAAAATEALMGLPSEEQGKQLVDFLKSQITRVVGIPDHRLNPDQPLNTLGIDSLMAIELKNTIEARLGVTIPIATLLQGPSLRELAEVIRRQIQPAESVAVSADRKMPEESREKVYALSHGQRAMWFQHQLSPESIYNIVYAVRILDEVDVPALKTAVQRIVDRHEALRTTFRKNAEGQPVQVVHPRMEAFFREVDARDWSEETLQERLREEAHRLFDLEKGPLMRVFLYRRGEKEAVLMLVTHHIVTDMWTQAVLLYEIGQLYPRIAGDRAAPEFLEQPPQYIDFVRWQQEMLAGREGERLFHYWRRQLGEELPLLNLATDRPRPPVQTFRGAHLTLRFSRKLSQKIKALSEETGATPYQILLAAFKVLLHRYSQQEDIIVGTPTTGRSRPEFMQTAGYFVNPIPLRTRIRPLETFRTYLQQVRQTVIEGLEHQDYPFPLMVEKFNPQRDPSRNPIFQVMFVLQRTQQLGGMDISSFALGKEGARMDLGGIQIESLELEQRIAPFELTFMMAEQNGELLANMVYNVDLYRPETVQRMLTHFMRILEEVGADPDTPIKDIALLTDEESSWLTRELNNNAGAFPGDRPVHQWFEQVVAEHADRVAVQFEGRMVKYRELNRRANQLAHFLVEKGVGPEVLVGLALPRSPDMVVAMLGVLKAGGAFLPLDPEYPTERLKFMMQDAGVRLVLTHSRVLERLPDGEMECIALDSQWDADIAGHPEANPERVVYPENLAYVIYTSGSTGRPKGVLIQHRGFANVIVAARDSYRVRRSTKFLQFASFSFDASIVEIFPTLMEGATVCMIPQEAVTSSAVLTQKIREFGITHAVLPPSMLSSLPEEAVQGIQVLVSAGEACPPDMAARFYQGRVFLNAYGPTENTVYTSCYEVTEEPRGATVPIGKPVQNTRFYVLDAFLNPVPVGVPGELYIGGVGVARGYLRRPRLTAERFLPDPFAEEPGARMYKTGDLVRVLPDGNIEFMGRVDYQIKLRGFRIELEEVESVMNAHPEVELATVVPDTRRQILNAYYVPRQPREAPTQELEWWPSVAEFFVYDDLLYYAMTHDDLRNEQYKAAYRKYVKDKVVLDIGTGKDAIQARFCIEAGARKVYAIELLEESYRKARETITRLGLQDKIILILGDAMEVELPETVDVITSEIVGAIGGSEAAAVILNHARRFLKKDGIMIPVRSVTRIAPVQLPRQFLDDPYFTEVTGHYVKQIFDQVGYRFDLRLSIKGLHPGYLIGNSDIFEDLDFSGEVQPEFTRSVRFQIDRDARLDGFLVWLTLYTDPEHKIDILENPHSWLPVYLPVFYPGIEVRRGDRIEATIISKLSSNGMNPDYMVKGVVHRRWGDDVPFEYVSAHFAPEYRKTPFYQKLFANDDIPIRRGTAPTLLTPEALKDYLRKYLPEYMVPANIISLAELPKTPSGKIDRAALPTPEHLRKKTGSLKPRNDLEEKLVHIWKEVLQLEDVGVTDNFFEMGGHSLAAIQVQTRIQELTGKELSLVDMFKYPTIEALARYLSGESGRERTREKVQDRASRRRDALSQKRDRLRKKRGR